MEMSVEMFADFAPEIDADEEIRTLRGFIRFWMHEGHLQTFEDRERFRGAARIVLKEMP